MFPNRENGKGQSFSALVIANEEASIKWSICPPLTLAFSGWPQPVWTNGTMPVTPEAGRGSCPPSFAIIICHLNPPHLSEQSPGDTGWSGAPSPPSLAVSAVVGEQSGFPSGAGQPQHLYWIICSREGSAMREIKLHKAAANLDLFAQVSFLLAGCLRIKGAAGRSLANIASSTVG